MTNKTNMAIRCWRLTGLVIAASGMAMAGPAVAEPDGLTNPVAETVQAEAPADQPAENQLRDPFWPVGYSPVTKMVPAADATTNAAVAGPDPGPVPDDLIQRALAMLRVGGIIRRGPKCYATVNGTMVEAGDTIPILVDENVVLFIVRSVDLKRIRIEPVRR